jgi:long-chain acyl-CoA synthetase
MTRAGGWPRPGDNAAEQGGEMDYDQRPWLTHYDAGVGPELDLPLESLWDGLTRIGRDFPDRAAFHFHGVSLTFAELFRQAEQFSRALADRGISPGDVVAINAPNLPQYLVALIGAMRRGCPVTGVSPLLMADETVYQLKDSGAKALVTLDPIFEHRLAPHAADLPDLKFVVSTGILDYLPGFKQFLAKKLKKVPTGKVFALPGKEVVTWKDMLRKTPADCPAERLGPEDTYLIQYTGGTTGLPKGAVLTHGNMLANVVLWNVWFHMSLGQDVAASGYPFFHIAGTLAASISLWHGVTQILIPNPRDTRHIVAEMKKYRPTFMNNVPSLYLLLMKEPGFKDLDFSGLKYATSAAAPFPVEPMRELERIVGGEKLVEIYGLTETSPMITLNPTLGTHKIGSVGVPAPSTHVRLVDPADGETLVPQGEKGELICRGPQVMKGYWNRPQETAHALREHDGRTWFHTGDILTMDQDGFFWMVDRSKDMINVSGFKVFPREVEEKLYEHPDIDVCAIVGVDNPERPGSEIVRLVVQLKPGDKSEEQVKAEIRAFCAEHMAPYKAPKIIDVVAEIPLTQAGKVDRKSLR